jgi:hypothetical protein
MANDKPWTEQKENEQDLFGNGLFPSRASKEMLKISDTNRLVKHVRQGRLLDALNMHINIIFVKLKTETGKQAFRPLADMNDYFQSIQLTLQGVSREDFKQIEIAKKQKKRGLFSRNKPASGVDQDSDESEGDD